MVVPATPTQSHMKMLVHGAKCSSFTIMLLKLWNVYNFLGLFFFHRRRKKYIIRGHRKIVFYWRSTIKQLYKRTQMIITPQITTQSQKTIHTMCIFIKIPEKWTEILKKKTFLLRQRMWEIISGSVRICKSINEKHSDCMLKVPQENTTFWENAFSFSTPCTWNIFQHTFNLDTVITMGQFEMMITNYSAFEWNCF